MKLYLKFKLIIFCILGNQPEKNIAVDNLKGAVKCSLAHLVDINSIGTVVAILIRELF
jgi:hypothetical protein